MAVLISGLYRTNEHVCRSHVDYIAKNPSAEIVDIFAYILIEDGDLSEERTFETIENGIRECYGHYLKKLTLKARADVEEDFPDKVDDNCSRMHRLHSQLKTLYMGGLDWWQWSVTNGIKHDTVLRIRTDHEFHGRDKPVFKPVGQLKGNELVLAPIAGGSPVPYAQHWFCSNPYGGMDIGETFSAPMNVLRMILTCNDSRVRSARLRHTISDAFLPHDVPRLPLCRRHVCPRKQSRPRQLAMLGHTQRTGI
jgi:hypothetical protein